MEKEKLQEFIDEGLSQRDIAEEIGKSHSSVRYWLKKYNLKTVNKSFERKEIIDGKKECTDCKEFKLTSDYYNRSDGKGLHSKCKSCANQYYTERIRKVKIRMIEYKGGCCERCKLKLEDTHYSVFDFHHINPKEKDPNFGKIKYQKWEVIKKEIDKCQLLCSNCHRIIHAELEGLEVGSLDIVGN